MIAYLDTSALIPLVIEESSSEACHTLWHLADDVTSSHLTWVEASAALAAAHRAGRLTDAAHDRARRALGVYWSDISVLAVDEHVIDTAAHLTRSHALRGYGAVHCATAAYATSNDMVAAAGDRRLLDAWASVGLQTVDINQ